MRSTLSLIAVSASLALLASAADAGTATTRLRIMVSPAGPEAGQVHRYTLACAPARGTVPHPVRACRLLGRLGAAAFAPTPADMACTEIWGGPEKAHVRGVIAGRAIDARFSLSDGCEIARWNRVAVVVPRG